MSKYIKLEDAISDLDNLWDYSFAEGINTPTALKQVRADLLNLPTIEVMEYPQVEGITPTLVTTEVSEDCISRKYILSFLDGEIWGDDDYIAGMNDEQREIREVVGNAPSVVPKPKEGEWVGEADGYWNGELIYDAWYCPFCDYRIEEDEQELLPNYCPNCGAKMKGERNEQ